MFVPVSTKAKIQFKMYLESETGSRLKEAASRFAKGSAQQVVEELIELYLPVWLSVNTAIDRAVDQQSRRILAHKETRPTKDNLGGRALAPAAKNKIPVDRRLTPAQRRKTG